MPGWGGLAENDQFYVADFDGDGKKDLFVFNGDDWSMTYVAMLRSTGTGFTLVRRFDGNMPGWEMGSRAMTNCSSATSAATTRDDL